MKRIARLMRLGRMRLDGTPVVQIAEHFNIHPSYVYMLLRQFDRVTTPEGVGKLTRYMAREEAKELKHIEDWLEFLAKEPQ